MFVNSRMATIEKYRDVQQPRPQWKTLVKYDEKSPRFLEIYRMRSNDNVMLLTTISAGAYDFLA